MQRYRPSVHLAVWMLFGAGVAVASAADGLEGSRVERNAAEGVPPVVVRGPYLQAGSESRVVVRWRTDVATDSRVLYGSQPGNLTSSVSSATATTEHAVTLTGLAAGTPHYYAVGTSTQVLAGDDADHFFVTAPAPGTPQALRIWVLGDSGTGDANAAAVRDAYYALAGATHTDLWLMLGDNAYDNGTDLEYQTRLFEMYPEMLRKSVLWPTKGNHDNADSPTQTGTYYDVFTMPANAEAGGVASGTEAYYSFDHGNVHFVVLDSHDTSRQPGSAMLTWLDLDLQSTTQDWVVAFWHHPPYSKGSHDSDNGFEFELVQMRENVVPILDSHGVDLVLAGHSHSYERSFLIDGTYSTPTPDFATLSAAGNILDAGDGRTDGQGAYQKASLGPAAHEGAVYVVAGSSGKLSPGTLDHPVMFASLFELGSVVLEIQGNILNARFLNDLGQVTDHFTIVKDGATPYCGNGIVEAGEQCDSDDLGGVSCDPSCTGGSPTCTSSCTVDLSTCIDCCDGDAICEPGEDCASCPGDCFSASAAFCGNGVCEAGDGEDCLSCPADCRGRQNGPQANRFCCGDGAGTGPVPCSNPVCTAEGWLCTDVAQPITCCGDATCEGIEDYLSCGVDCDPPSCDNGVCEESEDSCSCPSDCGLAPLFEVPGATCGDELDNDCDGQADCADADCLAGLLPTGASCSVDADCCSGKCRGRSGDKLCR